MIKHLGGFGMESLGPAAWKMSLMSVDPISGALPGGPPHGLVLITLTPRVLCKPLVSCSSLFSVGVHAEQRSPSLRLGEPALVCTWCHVAATLTSRDSLRCLLGS